MNYKCKAITICVLVLMLNACVFLPKTLPPSADDGSSCDMATSEWTVDVIPIVGDNSHCHDEVCAAIFIGVPLITAAFTVPIVIIGNTIHQVEKQFSCN